MKKILISLAILALPGVCFAQFDNNLYYGLTGNTDVTQLQEFLTAQGVYHGPITGNFFSLTLAGVKAFQTAESITPISGYFGPISRATANTILTSQITSDEENAATTTEPVDLSVQASTTNEDTQTSSSQQSQQTEPITQSQTQSTPPAPPTCTLTEVGTTPVSYYTSALAFSWTTQNAATGTVLDTLVPRATGGSASYPLIPLASGQLTDIPLLANNSFDATTSQEIENSVATTTLIATVQGPGGENTCSLTITN